MKNRGLDLWTGHRRGPARLAAALGLALAVSAIPAAADHGFPHIQQVARATFIDQVEAKIKSKVGSGRTYVSQVKDGSDMVILEITLQAGGTGPWHTHSGGGFLINLGPGTITNVVGEDCDPQLYLPGEAFVDPGEGVLHAVRNDSLEEVVLLAVFFGIEDGPVTPAPGPSGCNFLP